MRMRTFRYPISHHPQRAALSGQSISRYSQVTLNETMTPEFVREGIRHYLGMVSLIDQQIGNVVATLEAMGQLKNTYTCDHGEMLGTHGLWAKMNLIRLSPGTADDVPPAGTAGGLDDNVAELTVSPQPSLISPARRLARRAWRIVASQGPRSGNRDAGVVLFTHPVLRSLRTAQYRFTMEMHSGAACELFDMNDDPAEVTNLVNDPSRTHLVEELKTALVDLQRG